MPVQGKEAGGSPGPAGPAIAVEAVYATADEQWLVSLELHAGSTVADAIAAAFAGQLDRELLDTAPVGIWGQRAQRGQPLKPGDRVELYRPLRRDPREARREIAAAKDPG